MHFIQVISRVNLSFVCLCEFVTHACTMHALCVSFHCHVKDDLASKVLTDFLVLISLHQQLRFCELNRTAMSVHMDNSQALLRDSGYRG